MKNKKIEELILKLDYLDLNKIVQGYKRIVLYGLKYKYEIEISYNDKKIEVMLRGETYD